MRRTITPFEGFKLKRFIAKDRKDIEAMAGKGLVDPERLVERFCSALDRMRGSSFEDDFPHYIQNLNQVERDFLFVEEETRFDPDDWSIL